VSSIFNPSGSRTSAYRQKVHPFNSRRIAAENLGHWHINRISAAIFSGSGSVCRHVSLPKWWSVLRKYSFHRFRMPQFESAEIVLKSPSAGTFCTHDGIYTIHHHLSRPAANSQHPSHPQRPFAVSQTALNAQRDPFRHVITAPILSGSCLRKR
jgi:hypothetical protein